MTKPSNNPHQTILTLTGPNPKTKLYTFHYFIFINTTVCVRCDAMCPGRFMAHSTIPIPFRLLFSGTPVPQLLFLLQLQCAFFVSISIYLRGLCQLQLLGRVERAGRKNYAIAGPCVFVL
jgi:hypothetical protein